MSIRVLKAKAQSRRYNCRINSSEEIRSTRSKAIGTRFQPLSSRRSRGLGHTAAAPAALETPAWATPNTQCS